MFIFLLRQNFKSLPLDLEEAAMLDGAGTLRRLFSVVLPQSWPVVVTITLLQFFYTWNETRLVTLYVGPNPNFVPLSYAVQMYASLRLLENAIEATNLVMLIIPVIVLMVSQRFFMRSMVITGMEKNEVSRIPVHSQLVQGHRPLTGYQMSIPNTLKSIFHHERDFILPNLKPLQTPGPYSPN